MSLFSAFVAKLGEIAAPSVANDMVRKNSSAGGKTDATDHFESASDHHSVSQLDAESNFSSSSLADVNHEIPIPKRTVHASKLAGSPLTAVVNGSDFKLPSANGMPEKLEGLYSNDITSASGTHSENLALFPFQSGPSSYITQLGIPIEKVAINCDWLLKSVEDSLRHDRLVTRLLSEELASSKYLNEKLISQHRLLEGIENVECEGNRQEIKHTAANELKIIQTQLRAASQLRIASGENAENERRNMESLKELEVEKRTMASELLSLQLLLRETVAQVKDCNKNSRKNMNSQADRLEATDTVRNSNKLEDKFNYKVESLHQGKISCSSDTENTTLQDDEGHSSVKEVYMEHIEDIDRAKSHRESSFSAEHKEIYRNQILNLKQEISDKKGYDEEKEEAHRKLKAIASSSSPLSASNAETNASRARQDSDRLQEAREEKELLSDELHSLKAMLRDTMAQSEASDRSARDKESDLKLREEAIKAREGIYKREISQWLTDSNFSRDMVYSMNKENAENVDAFGDDDAVRLKAGSVPLSVSVERKELQALQIYSCEQALQLDEQIRETEMKSEEVLRLAEKCRIVESLAAARYDNLQKEFEIEKLEMLKLLSEAQQSRSAVHTSDVIPYPSASEGADTESVEDRLTVVVDTYDRRMVEMAEAFRLKK